MKPVNVVSTAEIADTGNTYRALLPYMKEEFRTTLKHYSGPGLVGNFRAVCFGLTASRLGLLAGLIIKSTQNGPDLLKNWSKNKFGLTPSCQRSGMKAMKLSYHSRSLTTTTLVPVGIWGLETSYRAGTSL
jgi:hypothetical protein